MVRVPRRTRHAHCYSAAAGRSFPGLIHAGPRRSRWSRYSSGGGVAVAAPARAASRARRPSTARTARSRSTAWTARQRDLVVVAAAAGSPRRSSGRTRTARTAVHGSSWVRRCCGPGRRRRRRPPGTGPSEQDPGAEHQPEADDRDLVDDVRTRRRRSSDDFSVSATNSHHDDDDGRGHGAEQPHAPRHGGDRRGRTGTRSRPPWSQHAADGGGWQSAGTWTITGTAQHEAWQAQAAAAGRAAARRTSGRSRCRCAARCATSASTPSPSTAAGSACSTPAGSSDEGWAALTAGSPPSAAGVADVRGVLVTHLHFDHLGLAERVREASGAWIAMHPADAAVVGSSAQRDAGRGRSPRRSTSSCPWAPTATRRPPTSGPREHLEAVHPHGRARPAARGRRARRLPGLADARRPHARATPPATCASPRSARGCSSPATTCCRGSARTSPPRTTALADPLRDYLDSLAAVAATGPGRGAARPRVALPRAGRPRRRSSPPTTSTGSPSCSTPIRRTTRHARPWQLAAHLTWSRPWDQYERRMRIFAVTETDAHLRLLASRGLVVERRRAGADVDPRRPLSRSPRWPSGCGRRRRGWAAPGWSASTGRPGRARPRSPAGWPPRSAPTPPSCTWTTSTRAGRSTGAVARLAAGVLRPLADGRPGRLPPLRLGGGRFSAEPTPCRSPPVLVVEGCGSSPRAVDAVDDAAHLGGGAARRCGWPAAWPATATTWTAQWRRWQRDGGRGVRRARTPAPGPTSGWTAPRRARDGTFVRAGLTRRATDLIARTHARNADAAPWRP